MSFSKFLVAFAGSALLSGGVCLSSTVFAANSGYSEAACLRLTNAQLECPFTDNRPSFEHINANTINVHAFVNSGSGVFANACVVFFDTTGATCGPTVSLAGTGLKMVSITGANLSVWKDANNQFDFPYVRVCSASSCTSGGISLQGVFFST
ncbi:MAG TPA: hypothetical protein VG937_26960 [Polyangiaceae bacterium]|nr:hypothetical protein [Polyangiaceae bacterium]